MAHLVWLILLFFVAVALWAVPVVAVIAIHLLSVSESVYEDVVVVVVVVVGGVFGTRKFSYLRFFT